MAMDWFEMTNRGAAAWALAMATGVSGAFAGQYVLLADQANTVPIAINVQNGDQACNIEISVQGLRPFDREVRAPHYEARITIKPQGTEQVSVTWQGKARRVNDTVINACPTMGQTQFSVIAGQPQSLIRPAWDALFMGFGRDKAVCMRTALRLEGVRTEVFDLNDKQVTREDWKIHRASAECDGFVARKKAWGEQNHKAYPCVLAGGLKTQCEGYFTALVNGKSQVISYDEAVQLQLQGQAWGTGVRELGSVRAARARQIQQAQALEAAQAAAKAKAQEDARLEEERRAQEARLAEEKAKREEAAAEKAAKLAVIERVEREQREKRNWLRKQLDKLKEERKPEPKGSDKADAKGKAAESAPATVPVPAATSPAPPAEAKAEVKPEPKPEGK